MRTSHRRRRGLTLVEVLFAAALLATVAAAAAPLFHAATSTVVAGPDSADPGELAFAIDGILDAPSDFGLDLETDGPWEVEWPEDGRTIAIERLPRSEPDSGDAPAIGGSFLLVRCGDASLVRWTGAGPASKESR